MPSSISNPEISTLVKTFLSFINDCPSPYHVVRMCRQKLLDNGFQELNSADCWKILPKKKYFVTKNQSCLIAFTVGGNYNDGNGMSIIGTHTDSPCLKIKPRSSRHSGGYLKTGVECYGGGIWSSWFDRDLTVAGRLIVKENGHVSHKLVNLKKPILRVPHLAIHLDRSVNDGFAPNKESHIVPILATEVEAKLCGVSHSDNERISNPLLAMLAKEVDIPSENIVDFDLCLADTQPACVGGIFDEFIFSPRLDNLLNTFCAVEALIKALPSVDSDPNVRVVALFDNEEVGSCSAQGAQSAFIQMVLKRIADSLHSNSFAFERAISKSLLISADQAHALHPNYEEKHESNHQPAFHKGVVLKVNSNQRYASTGITNAILRVIAEKAGVPLQEYVVRNDSPCGSTIGPLLSASLGIPTIDVGGPQLSMHSIREMCDISSLLHCVNLYRAFFKEFPNVSVLGE